MNKSKRLPAIPAGSRFVLFIWRDAAAIRMLLFATGVVVLRRGGSARAARILFQAEQHCGCKDHGEYHGGKYARLEVVAEKS